MGFNYKKHMFRTRQNSAFDQPERWFCGMFLGQSWPGVSISQHIWAISSSFQVSPGQSWFFSNCGGYWSFKARTSFLENWQLLMWIEPLVSPLVKWEPFVTHLGKTWFPSNFSLSKIWSLEPPAIQPWWGMFFPAAGKPWHCRGHGPCGILAPCCAGGQ